MQVFQLVGEVDPFRITSFLQGGGAQCPPISLKLYSEKEGVEPIGFVPTDLHRSGSVHFCIGKVVGKPSDVLLCIPGRDDCPWYVLRQAFFIERNHRQTLDSFFVTLGEKAQKLFAPPA